MSDNVSACLREGISLLEGCISYAVPQSLLQELILVLHLRAAGLGESSFSASEETEESLKFDKAYGTLIRLGCTNPLVKQYS